MPVAHVERLTPAQVTTEIALILEADLLQRVAYYKQAKPSERVTMMRSRYWLDTLAIEIVDAKANKKT